MKPLKASVIIPAFNSEKTLSECLNALKNQSTRPLETIVIDDGSNDQTLETARKLGAKVLAQRHAGPAAARNRGARHANGEILLFTDADCVPDKNWVREMLLPFQDSKISGAQGRYTTSQKALLARFSQFEIGQRYVRLSQRKYIDFIGTYSAAYRRGVFLKFKGFDESFPKASGEDPEFSFRLAKAGHKMVFSPKALVSHQHPDTLKKYLRQKFGRARWRIPLYRKHPGKMAREAYTPQGLKMQIGLIYLLALSLILFLFQLTMLYTSLALVILLLLSTLPFAFKSGKKSRSLGLASPFILILRSLAFSAGLIYGLLKGA